LPFFVRLILISGKANGENRVSGALATLHSALGLDLHSLRLHREDPKTTHACPGPNVVKNDVIEEMIAHLPGVHGEHPAGVMT
jgi:hypothetical protein